MGRETLDQLIENAEKVDVTGYELTYGDVCDLLARYDNRRFDLIHDLYRIGFLKGQRAEKAGRRKAARHD